MGLSKYKSFYETRSQCTATAIRIKCNFKVKNRAEKENLRNVILYLVIFCSFCCRLWIFCLKNLLENSSHNRIVRDGVSLWWVPSVLADYTLSTWAVSFCRWPRGLSSPLTVSLSSEEKLHV